MKKFKVNYINFYNRVVKTKIVEMYDWQVTDFALGIIRTTNYRVELRPVD